jgi:segregation and condensation protein A
MSASIMPEESVAEQAYQVKLAHVFEGPMDLLIHLIRKNELDIYDIPIAFITERFLEYIEWMKAMNINVAADFLVMAATLAHIKSKTLLPDSKPDDAGDEDPRDAIAGPLIEYIRMKAAADALARRNILNEDVYSRSAAEKDRARSQADQPIEADIIGLARTWRDLVERASPALTYEITPERISVRDKMTQILNLLEDKDAMTFSELASMQADRSELVIAFLAVLEIARMNLVQISDAANGNFIIHAL